MIARTSSSNSLLTYFFLVASDLLICMKTFTFWAGDSSTESALDFDFLPPSSVLLTGILAKLTSLAMSRSWEKFCTSYTNREMRRSWDGFDL